MVFDSEKKLKEKIRDVNQEVELEVETLKNLRARQKELCEQLAKSTDQSTDFDNLIGDIQLIRRDEAMISKATDEDFSDPSLKDSAISEMESEDKAMHQAEENLETDEAKEELAEEGCVETEKELEKITRQIIKSEERIKDLEEKSTRYTKKLEEEFES